VNVNLFDATIYVKQRVVRYD